MNFPSPTAGSNPVAAVATAQRPLRILHLTNASDAGGLSRYIFDLAFAMQLQGHEVVIAGERGPWHGLFQDAPFQWIDTPLKGNYLNLRRGAKQLSRWLDTHPVDVLHAHYRRTTLVGRLIQRDHPIPLLYTSHSWNLPLHWPWKWFTDFGDHVHVPSDEVRQWLIREAHFPQERISLIPHGIDARRFPQGNPETRHRARAELNLADDDVVAAFVGRLEDPKNEQWMLDLAVASREHLPKLKVLIVGDGPREQLVRDRVRKEGLQDRVRLLGNRDPRPVYHASDALLSPSGREGFSLVSAEAMATGIPVLRTRTGGSAALVVENATGRTVPIDHDAFVNGAMQFLSDVPALQRMGKLASLHVQQHFTFDRQLRETLDLYRSLIRMQRADV